MDINTQALESVAQEMRGIGAEVLPLTVDLSDRTAVEAAIRPIALRREKAWVRFIGLGSERVRGRVLTLNFRGNWLEPLE